MTKWKKDDNNYVYYWVGKNIRKYRKSKGWTQRELAEKCSYTENFIGDLENETFKTCSLNTLYHISKILDIHMKSLFDDLDEEENK